MNEADEIRIHIPRAMLTRIINALEYYAHMEAGQTQKPDLCDNEDYQEWDDAQELRKKLEK